MTDWSFTKHPASVGESYFEHMGSAFGFGLRMLGAGLACMIHGILPFLFVKTGSTTVAALHSRMIVHRKAFPRADANAVSDSSGG
jgi:hypothetical protein